jgi:hypothetical protein
MLHLGSAIAHASATTSQHFCIQSWPDCTLLPGRLLLLACIHCHCALRGDAASPRTGVAFKMTVQGPGMMSWSNISRLQSGKAPTRARLKKEVKMRKIQLKRVTITCHNRHQRSMQRAAVSGCNATVLGKPSRGRDDSHAASQSGMHRPHAHDERFNVAGVSVTCVIHASVVCEKAQIPSRKCPSSQPKNDIHVADCGVQGVQGYPLTLVSGV